MTSWRVIQGDCIEVMAAMPEASIDAVVCDPPYGLGFMGEEWDSPGGTGDFPMRRTDATNTVNTGASRQGGRQRSTEDFAKRQARDARSYQEWCETWAIEALRVLKPGGHLLAMGGTRTYHRLAAGIEDAGFEIRDTIAWLYGSGFPKSRNLDGDWQGWGTALKPAHEPCVVARKSLVGTVAANVAEHGTGAVNVDGCRIGADGGTKAVNHATKADGRLQRWDDAGRWPANVVLDPEAAAMLDEQTGELASGKEATGGHVRRADVNRTTYGAWPGDSAPGSSAGALYGDSGGASRFFYVAKPDAEERSAGLHGQRNPHPTVKPMALMRWLTRLVTPPGGIVLDPFTGSGTTGIAALREGFSFVGIEQAPGYVDVARARIIGDAPLLNSVNELVPQNDTEEPHAA